MDVGRYEIVQKLGEGGMGIVHLARDRDLGRLVALKTLKAAYPRLIERFHREAQNAARLSHPNVVTVYEAGNDGETLFIAMEYIAGEPLQTAVASLPLRGRIAILEEVARGIEHAHSKGVIHRDLKPQNILVDPKGRPHVLDFGLSRSLDSDEALTVTGASVGTPFYMSPEQVRGRRDEIGPQTDVYALGVLLYETLTGELPFPGQTAGEVYDRILHGEVTTPSGRVHGPVPRELEVVCLKAMERERSRRYRTAGAFADDLARWLAGEPVLARPPSVLSRAKRMARRHPIVTTALLALLPGFVVAAAIYTRTREAERRLREDAELEPVLLKIRGLPPAEGRRQFEEAAKKFPSSSRFWYERGCFEQQHRQAEPAIAAFTESIRLNPGNFMAYYQRGTVIFDYVHDPARALGDFETCLRLDPDNEYAHLGRARVAVCRKRFAEAEDILRAAGSTHLRDFWMIWGECLGRRPEPDLPGAIEKFDEACRLDPRYEPAYTCRGLIKLDARDFQGALSDYERAVELAPQDPMTWSNRGAAQVKLGRLEKGLLDLQRAVEIAPDRAHARLNLASLLALLGRRKEALEEFDRALAIAPKDARIWNERGLTALETGDAARCISDCGTAIELDPTLASAYEHRGRARHRLGEDARADLDRAVELDPKRGSAWTGRAIVRRSLEDAETGVKLDDSVEARTIRGFLYAEKGDPTAAERDFNEVILRGGADDQVWNKRGECRRARSDTKAAEADFGKAIEANGGVPEYWGNRGCMRMAQALYEHDDAKCLALIRGAIADFEQGLKVAPPDWPGRAQTDEWLAGARRSLLAVEKKN